MSNYIIKDGELMHYGVLGMKWGIRKGRVSVGTQHKVGDSFNLKDKAKMTKQAIKTLNNQHKQATTYAILGKDFVKQAKMLEKKLDDINSNKLKAGKDFVVNTTYSSNLLLDAVGLINISRERKVDFKK